MPDHISDPFLPHVPSEEAVRKINKIRETAIELNRLLEDIPNPRYRALARTNLEDSVMWAVRGHSIPG